MLFHFAKRTWFLLAVAGAILVAASAYARAPSGRARRLVAIGAALLYAVALVLARFATGTPFSAADYLTSVAVMGLVLLLWTFADARGTVGAVSGALLIALGAGTAWQLRSKALSASVEALPRGELYLAATESIVKGAPARLHGQYAERVGTNVPFNLGFLLDASCATSYPIRLLPAAAWDAFERLGVIAPTYFSQLPYTLDLDYERMQELGILPLLGIRHWLILDIAKQPTFLRGPGTPIGGPFSIRYYEDPSAFPKAWALARWSVAASFDQAIEGVKRLGGAKRLGEEAVIESPGAPTQGPAASADAAAQPTVELLEVGPGRISLRVVAPAPALVVTTELFQEDWRVAIDDQPQKTTRADALLLAAFVPAGTHRVVFRSGF
jgi:hypothetical protein